MLQKRELRVTLNYTNTVAEMTRAICIATCVPIADFYLMNGVHVLLDDDTLLKSRLSARVGICLRFCFRGGNPTLSDDGSTVGDDVILDDMSDILNNAVTSILASECDMSYSDVQFSNIDANLEMIQNCVVNDSVQATRLYEALCIILKGHMNELLSDAIRQSQHLVRRICIINESMQGSENIDDRLEIRLDELTDILQLVNSDGLLPNIEVFFYELKRYNTRITGTWKGKRCDNSISDKENKRGY